MLFFIGTFRNDSFPLRWGQNTRRNPAEKAMPVVEPPAWAGMRRDVQLAVRG
jgi:hypothetical protein